MFMYTISSLGWRVTASYELSIWKVHHVLFFCGVFENKSCLDLKKGKFQHLHVYRFWNCFLYGKLKYGLQNYNFLICDSESQIVGNTGLV